MTHRPTPAPGYANAGPPRRQKSRRPNRRRSSGHASADAAHTTAPAGRAADPVPATRRSPRRRAIPGADTSVAHIPRQPDTAEDLTTVRMVPVAEAGAQDRGLHGPRATPQHPVVAVKK